MNAPYSRVSGSLLFLGGSQFIIFMVVAEALHPGYSVSGNFISDLGVGPAAPIFNTSIIVLGLTVIVSSYLIFKAFKSTLVTILLTLSGLGAVGVGVFPETAGLIHSIMATVAFFFGSLSAIIAYRIEGTPMKYLSVMMGIASLVALIFFGLGLYFGLGQGGMERMVAYPALVWLTAFGGYLTSSDRTT